MAETVAAEAGMELDAQVCNAVGIRPRIEYGASHDEGASFMYWSRYRGEVERFIADYRDRMPGSLPAQCDVVEVAVYPPVSTDVSAAFQVVNALMKDRAFMVSVNVSHESGWWCVVYPPSGPSIDSPYEETAPLAICRAALAAVGAADA